jgi:hypothetical protein
MAVAQPALQRLALHAVGATRLRVVLVPVYLLLIEERPEHGRRARQQRKACLVASRFVRGLHAYRGASTHAGPQQRREAGAPA